GLTSSLETQDDLDNQSNYNQSYTNQSGDKCNYWYVVEHLNLTKNKDKFTMSRPVKHYEWITLIYIEMKIYAILDVREADQSFISYMWINMQWDNEFIEWNPKEFCGLSKVLVPRESLWMPDITIEEMTEKDKNQPSPFVSVKYNGWVDYRDDKFMISTCKMKIFNFPFDIQTCHLTFRSILYSDDEFYFIVNNNSTEILKDSLTNIRMQYEWELCNMSVTRNHELNFNINQTVVVYTITMKRKSALYVVNFLLPVLFFLCLDFASLLMPTGGGEKISFKITVLLAVTVMQLILIEILPFTSSRIPLIVIYCIGVFALMLSSLIETIFVNYLMEKDSSSLQGKKETDKLQVIKASSIASTCDEMTDQTPSMCKGGSSSQLTELFLAVEKFSDELGEMKKIVLDKESEEKKDGYWTGVAK
ncbi:hypothetical protein CCH79_00003134, partial [Gambusia affinis]